MHTGISAKAAEIMPAESEFLFEIDPEPAPERLTSYGGAAVLIRTLRSLGVPQSVARHIHIKQRERGYDEVTFVESFVLLNGVGGECLEDFEQLRADAGLSSTLGHELPSPTAARNFLYEFHDASKIETAQQQRSLGAQCADRAQSAWPCQQNYYRRGRSACGFCFSTRRAGWSSTHGKRCCVWR